MSTQLRGFFLADDTMWVVVACFGLVWLLLVSGYWPSGLAMAGFLRYILAINEHNKELMCTIRANLG
ncbi:hypothetical protein E2562_018833 [Oryza meyeriana var. granulata]|uniref:Uncharacterized protein n=1 Tax=Oryza meyeriana var. granulata TaxID=110450 RepID=A0A6G1F9R8_9ORYZ|nr:hypothetical protein E2562_018833 [Oryza meyeriana var. granulata]